MSLNQYKIEHYLLGETIGRGGSAKVKLARHEFTGNQVAIKIINKAKIREMRFGARIKREISLLRYFNHPNIIKMYEVLETQTDIFLITEYASKGEISNLIPRFSKLSEKEAKFYFRQIIAAVEYCHGNLIAHRDLKPENIFLDHHDTVKLADFGLANLMRDGKLMKTDCGSPHYVAPEVISKRKYCGSETDIWSCGIVLFALLAGSLPFHDESLPVLLKKIVKGVFDMPGHFSKEAKDLIKRMLTTDPIERITIQEIKQHEWMRQTGVLYLDPERIRSCQKESIKMKEEVLQKIMESEFNLHGYNEQKIREAIEKKRDFSFVIGYHLLLDELSKKEILSKLVREQKELTLGYVEKEPVKDMNCEMKADINQDINQASTMMNSFGGDSAIIAECNKFSELFDSHAKVTSQKTSRTRSSVTSKDAHVGGDQWHYGLSFNASAGKLMEAIMESLTQLHTIYFVNPNPYKLKCHYNLSKETCISSLPPTEQPIIKKANSKKEDKFSKTELAFKIQIYKIPNTKNQHVVDLQRITGHTLVFLDYSQKLALLLGMKLSEQ